MKKKFFISQENINDCGAASLAMILNLFDKNVSLKEIKEKIKIDKEGACAYDIVKISNEYGIIAKGYKNCELNNIKVPAIIHVINENNLSHFMVLLKVFKDKVLVADPASNIRFINIDEFNRYYTKIAILFENNINKGEFKKQIFLAIKTILLTLFFSLFSIFSSFIFSNILEGFNSYNNIKQIYITLIFFLIISLLKEIVAFIRQKVALKFEVDIDYKITINTLKKLISLPYNFYNQNDSGQLIAKVNDLSYIKEMIYILVEELSINIILLISILSILILIDKFLFIISLIGIILVFLIDKNFLKRNYTNIYDLQIKNEILNGNINNFLNGISTIKNLRKESFFKNKLELFYTDFSSKNKNLNNAYQNKSFINNIILLILKFIIFLVLIYRKINAYKAVFIISLIDTISTSTLEFCKVQMLYANYKSAKKRLDALDYINNNNSSSKIKIKNIMFKDFSYKIRDLTILNNVNFNINKGDWVFVCGKAGSGKTTLFKLLTRQLDTTNKGIYINGKDINEFSLDTILKSITYVDQKAKLFNMSIRENIYFYRKKEDKLIENFLKEEKLNKDLIVDNTSSNISGGMMQKVIIAQTLLNASSIIIFDETTNQIDVEEELKILKYIKKYYKDKTIILISHRKNNSFLFNKIISFENKNVKVKYKEEKNGRVKE